MTDINDMPLCGGGRCEQLLAGIAKVRSRTVEHHAGLNVRVLSAALTQLGLDASDEAVRSAVAAGIQQVLDEDEARTG